MNQLVLVGDQDLSFMGYDLVVPTSPLHARGCHQVTHYLGGENYVFWGGREGYQTLLNTDMERELDHMARFFEAAVAYKKKIGFKGQPLVSFDHYSGYVTLDDRNTELCSTTLLKHKLILVQNLLLSGSMELAKLMLQFNKRHNLFNLRGIADLSSLS
ncbi:hypothetical protein L6452_32429 [Arctium lappa]|uniref:Uncharacterized protein n=1 Tax=Arctium lappa TaxID=4217 RepID=A0ACB8Z3N7_ARCLA|nr:hypothetical protein L6452_32429 [Arctium lappa]